MLFRSSQRFLTVRGPPPIQPRSTAHGPWWVPPVSDHSGGDPSWRARCPCRGRAVGGLWVCCGLTCVVADTRPLRGSGFLTLDRTGGLGSRAHVPAQMRHPGRADAAGPVLETATCQSLGGWRQADRALGLPVALLRPLAVCFLRPLWAHTPDAQDHGGSPRSGPASCAGRGGPSAGPR